MKKTLLAFVLFSAIRLTATHVSGVQISYTYKGTQNDSSRNYLIGLNMFAKCGGQSILLPNSVDLCIYDIDQNKLFKTISIDKTYSYNHKDCSLGCLNECLYEKMVNLPANNNGYIVSYIICCRPIQDNLLLDQNGLSYQGLKTYTTIPAKINNSSPKYNLTKTIFTKPNGTDSIDLILTDSDNDSVVVSIANSLIGGSLNDNYPGCSAQYGLDQDVTYNAGYSSIYPFGQNGVFAISNDFKSIYVKSLNEGHFAVAYNVSEYRNGTLINVSHIESSVIFSNSLLHKPNGIKLTGSRENYKNVILNWNSLCPMQISNQVLERSFNSNNNFTFLAQVSNEINTFKDTSLPYKTPIYYRVKALDADSNTIISDTFTVVLFSSGLDNFNSNNLQFNIKPNPSHQVFHLTSQMDFSEFSIFNANGQLQMQTNMTEPSLKTEIDLTEFPVGIYFIKVTLDNGWIQVSTLIKE
ncbi:MAG TPA: T9SS type A sorting domain-containing protein [Bacteroidia bacterium]